MPAERLTAEQLARCRADYHQCGVTIVPLLDHVDAVTAERDEALAETRRWRMAAQARDRGHHDRMAGKTLEECPYPAPATPEGETSERAWWAVEWRNTDAQLTLGAVEAERDRLRAAIAEAVGRINEAAGLAAPRLLRRIGGRLAGALAAEGEGGERGDETTD